MIPNQYELRGPITINAIVLAILLEKLGGIQTINVKSFKDGLVSFITISLSTFITSTILNTIRKKDMSGVTHYSYPGTLLKQSIPAKKTK